MKKSLVWLLLTLTISAHGQAPVPVGEVDGMAAINRLRENLVTSFGKGDVDGLLADLDAEVIVTWQNGEVCHGPEEVRAFYDRMMTGEKRVVREIKSNPAVLGRHVEKDWAVSWGNLHDHFVLTDGSDLPFNSVFTATIAKRGDRWMVTAFHTSVSAFDNPVLTTALRKTGLGFGIGGAFLGLIGGYGVGRLRARRKPRS